MNNDYGWMGVAFDRKEALHNIEDIIGELYGDLTHMEIKEEDKQKCLQQLDKIGDIIDKALEIQY